MSSRIFCLVGPSGSGKSSISKKIVKKNDQLLLSISTTTREPRKGEVEGVNYFYVSKQEFEKRIDNNLFLEYAKYGDNLYGTENKNIEIAKSSNKILILDIEYQGVIKLKKEHDVTAIFISAPSKEVLLQRLRNRKDTSEEQIEQRLLIAKKEVSELIDNKLADYLIINNDLDTAISAVESVINDRGEEYRVSSYSEAELACIKLL